MDACIRGGHCASIQYPSNARNADFRSVPGECTPGMGFTGLLWPWPEPYSSPRPRQLHLGPMGGRWFVVASTMSIWKTLSRVFRIGHARFMVGKDLADNTYYEFPSPSGSLDPRHTRRYVRTLLRQCDEVESIEAHVRLQSQRSAHPVGRLDAAYSA